MIVVKIRGGPRDGETRAVPTGTHELVFALMPDVLQLIDEAAPLDVLEFDEVRLPIDPAQAELGIPLQWPTGSVT